MDEVCVCECRYLCRPEEGIRSPWTWNYRHLWAVWPNQTWVLCKSQQYVLLRTEPFLRPKRQWYLDVEIYGVWNLLSSVCSCLTSRQASEGQLSLLLSTNSLLCITVQPTSLWEHLPHQTPAGELQSIIQQTPCGASRTLIYAGGEVRGGLSGEKLLTRDKRITYT